MDYQEDYIFPGDEDYEVDLAALEAIYEIREVPGCDSWRAEFSQCVIFAYQAVPIIKDFCASHGQLIGRIPGRLEIFHFRESQLIGILSLEKWVESNEVLAQSIWKFIGKAGNFLNIDCASSAGDSSRLEISTAEEIAKNPDLTKSQFSTLASAMMNIAINENLPCSLYRLIYQGYRPSIASLMELAASINLEIPTLSVEEMRKAQSKHLVFEEAAVMYL